MCRNCMATAPLVNGCLFPCRVNSSLCDPVVTGSVPASTSLLIIAIAVVVVAVALVVLVIFVVCYLKKQADRSEVK